MTPVVNDPDHTEISPNPPRLTSQDPAPRLCKLLHAPAPGLLGRFLRFLDIFEPFELPTDRSVEDENKRALSVTKSGLGTLKGAWENQYKETHDDLANVRVRAASLLTATALVAGLISVLGPLGTWLGLQTHIGGFTRGIVAGVMVLLFVILLSGFATIYLSIKAQEPHDWDCAEVFLDQNRTVTYEVEYLHQLNIACQRNTRRLNHYERCLTDAQQYFRILVAALIIMVALVIAILLVLPSAPPAPGH